MWQTLSSVLTSLVEKHVPKIKVGGKPKKGSFPVAFDLRDMIRLKKVAHRKWIRNIGFQEEEKMRLEYVRLRNKVKYELRKARRSYEADIASSAKEKPQKFWSHARKMLKTRCGVSPLLSDPKDAASLCFEDREKACVLQ